MALPYNHDAITSGVSKPRDILEMKQPVGSKQELTLLQFSFHLKLLRINVGPMLSHNSDITEHFTVSAPLAKYTPAAQLLSLEPARRAQ